MTQLKDLSKNARQTLAYYVDVLVRKQFSLEYQEHSEKDIMKVVERVKENYTRRRLEKEAYEEIYNALQSQEFINDLKIYISNFLNNRPTVERITYYRSLCRQYGLGIGSNINKKTLELRIARIIETGGKDQNITR
ncbi:hypothetical protein [Paenibacillus sp. NAIST15-1]|uniref:hypothetical protein n=1 Tax=Paenibacillus sp. NAIST15-1 TaxID=1605994 RepID=UPI00086ED185|nr:hypothetical protein [Paenibacillus sp. NAIST15-1]GAV11367.1 hypothetical protein PBN151_1294 [Paenibacillus sp. NAIST15-1]